MAEIIDVPAALIMRIIGEDISVFLASHSSDNPYTPGEKEHLENSGLYCETVIKSRQELLVPDALADAKWRHNPDIKLGMVSYLGYPILYPNGLPFGTLCILDRQANAYAPRYEKLMQKLRVVIESQLALVFANFELGEKNRQLTDLIDEIKTLRGIIPICASCKKVRDDQGYWDSVEHYIETHSTAKFSHGLCDECLQKLYGNEPWFHPRKQ